MAYHVSKAKFAQLVEAALAELPEQFAQYLEEVPVQIEMRPSKRLLKREGLTEDDVLMGLYQGSSLLDRIETEGFGSPVPNHILIFQEDHERVSNSAEELKREVRITVLHELAHHLGMDEDQLEELGYD